MLPGSLARWSKKVCIKKRGELGQRTRRGRRVPGLPGRQPAADTYWHILESAPHVRNENGNDKLGTLDDEDQDWEDEADEQIENWQSNCDGSHQRQGHLADHCGHRSFSECTPSNASPQDLNEISLCGNEPSLAMTSIDIRPALEGDEDLACSQKSTDPTAGNELCEEIGTELLESGHVDADNIQVFLRDGSDAISALCSFGSRVYQDLSWAKVQQFILGRIPILGWLPEYSFGKFAKDLQAGLVVGCMLVPQSMGYASVAGLPVEMGLYASLLPLMVYACFGSSRQMGVGPVAIISLLASQGLPACSMLCKTAGSDIEMQDPYPNCPTECEGGQALEYNKRYMDLASICATMSGVLQVVLAPLLGFVINFVPHPVIAGFTSAGGLIIAMSQLDSVMGYPIRKDRLQVGIYDLLVNIGATNGISFAMGVTAIVFLYFVRNLGQSKILCWPAKLNPWVTVVAKLPWALGLVILYTAVTAALGLGDEEHGVEVVGDVPSGLPSFQVPPDLVASVPALLSISVQIVIIGYLESIAVETKFSTLFKYQIRPTQEAMAQGLANVVCGLTGGYPVAGSFSRSATNAAYGSQTPMCNLVTSLVIMLSLLFLTPLFRSMPLNVLSAIVVVAAVSLVDLGEAVFLWRSSKKEWVLMMLTFTLTAFVALELGILIAVGVCVAEVLFKSTRPKVIAVSDDVLVVYLPGAGADGRNDTDVCALQRCAACLRGRSEAGGGDGEVLVCRVEGDLNFAAASQLKKIVGLRFLAVSRRRKLGSFVLDLCAMDIVDTTALSALLALVESIESHSTAVFIVGVPRALHRFMRIDAVRSKLSRVNVHDSLNALCHAHPGPAAPAPAATESAARRRGPSNAVPSSSARRLAGDGGMEAEAGAGAGRERGRRSRNVGRLVGRTWAALRVRVAGRGRGARYSRCDDADRPPPAAQALLLA